MPNPPSRRHKEGIAGEVERLRHRGIIPRRSLGQHFLFHRPLLDCLLDAAGVREGDWVLEVGCGSGSLTRRLLERKARVIGVEVDKALCRLLREDLAGWESFSLIEGDVLAGKHAVNHEVLQALEQAPQGVKLVANLPFGAATPLLVCLLLETENVALAVVTVQREAAERFVAKPGRKPYGAVSVLAWAVAEVQRVRRIPRGAFWPPPKVDGAVVRFVPRGDRPPRDRLAALKEVVRTAFNHRRKLLLGVLRRRWPGVVLEDLIPKGARAGDLSPSRYLELAGRIQRGNAVRGERDLHEK